MAVAVGLMFLARTWTSMSLVRPARLQSPAAGHGRRRWQVVRPGPAVSFEVARSTVPGYPGSLPVSWLVQAVAVRLDPY